MSPELLNPEEFGLIRGRRTKDSDCYALGMVVYEVLSGRVPFYRYTNIIVIRYVINGQRPGRPQGQEGWLFTDDVWELLEGCWAEQSSERPSIENVLQHLEEVSRSWTPPSPQMVAGPPTVYSDSADETTWEVKCLLCLDVHLSTTDEFSAFLF